MEYEGTAAGGGRKAVKFRKIGKIGSTCNILSGILSYDRL